MKFITLLAYLFITSSVGLVYYIERETRQYTPKKKDVRYTTKQLENRISLFFLASIIILVTILKNF